MPTVLVLDSVGKERFRLEGYLPPRDFNAALRCALGRLAFVQKKFDEAERRYDQVVTQFGGSQFAAEAMFWRGVSRYSATHDHAALKATAEELENSYSTSAWAVRATPWL